MRWEEDPGGALLQDLRQRSPEETGRYVLLQAKFLRQPGLDVTQTDLYKVAAFFRTLPSDEQKQLICTAVAGFVTMPDGVRKEMAAVACELVRDCLSAVREGGAEPTGSPRDNEHFPPMLANTLKVIEGGGFYDLELDDQQLLIREATQVAVSAGPADGPPMRELMEFACEVHAGLNGRERKQLSKTVAAPRMLGEGQMWIVERVLQTNGYAEMGKKVLDAELSVRRMWWVFLLAQLVQIGLCFQLKPCPKVPMLYWLGADAGLWLAASVSGWLAYRWGCPSVRDVLKILTGAPGAAPAGGDGVGPLWPAIVMAILCCLFLTTGSLAALVANVYLVMAVFEDCSVPTVSVCAVFILLRHVATSVVAFQTAWVVQEVCFVMRKLVNPSLTDSPKKNYGSAEEAA
jgi:hypothetical protein